WCFFSWYAYPSSVALVAAGALGWGWAAPLFENAGFALARSLAVAGAVLLVPLRGARFFIAQGLHWTIADNSLTAMAVELSRDLQDRTGTFAMGDKAGIATFLLQTPLVHLRGLV